MGWDADGNYIYEWDTGFIVCALTSMNGYLYSGSADKIYRWGNLQNGKIIKWKADGDYIYEWDTGCQVNELTKLTNMNGYLYFNYKSFFGEKIIQWDADGNFIYDWETNRYVNALTAMDGYIYSVSGKKIIQWNTYGTKDGEWEIDSSVNALTSMNGFLILLMKIQKSILRRLNNKDTEKETDYKEKKQKLEEEKRK